MLQSRQPVPQAQKQGATLTEHDLTHELDVAVRLAHQAGAAIMDYYQTGLAVERKAGDEPVTAADQVADDLIRAGLGAAFPADGLLTEESEDDLSRLEKERVWIVDPLDGTTEFVNETGEFAVQIALDRERLAGAGRGLPAGQRAAVLCCAGTGGLPGCGRPNRAPSRLCHGQPHGDVPGGQPLPLLGLCRNRPPGAGHRGGAAGGQRRAQGRAPGAVARATSTWRRRSSKSGTSARRTCCSSRPAAS